MTRKDFETIAATLATLEPDRGNRYAPRSVRAKGAAAHEQWRRTVEVFAQDLARENPRFNAARFRNACGYEVVP